MKTPQLLLALVFSLVVGVEAQPRHIETIIAVNNENGDIAAVRFGLDSSATMGLDNGLEFAVPGFPPQPAGLQVFLAFKDNNMGVLSYTDYRPFPAGPVFVDTFALVLTPSSDASRGARLSFQWAWPLDPNIDSIVVTDGLGGVIKRIKFDSREHDTLTGNAVNLEQFLVRVYYNVKISAVDEHGETNGLVPSYVCTNGVLHLKELGVETADEYEYSLSATNGTTVLNGRHSSVIDLRDLSGGAYILQLKDRASTNRLFRILKY